MLNVTNLLYRWKYSTNIMQMLKHNSCVAQDEQIGYQKRVTHASKRKANGRTKEKDQGGGSRDQNMCECVVCSCPPLT